MYIKYKPDSFSLKFFIFLNVYRFLFFYFSCKWWIYTNNFFIASSRNRIHLKRDLLKRYWWFAESKGCSKTRLGNEQEPREFWELERKNQTAQDTDTGEISVTPAVLSVPWLSRAKFQCLPFERPCLGYLSTRQ